MKKKNLAVNNFSLTAKFDLQNSSYPTQRHSIIVLCLVIECKEGLVITINLSLLMHSGDLRMVFSPSLLIIAWFLTPVRSIFLALLGMISVIRVA